MAVLAKLQNIEKKFAFSLLGFILAIIFGALSIYTAFYQKRSPALKFEIESSASVFDIREDVGKLDVIFNGVNLRETRQTLTLMTLKVSNNGSEPILKTSYDDRDPLGFEITTGQIIKADLLRANKAYLTNNLNLTTASNSMSVAFSPVIIEPDDAFWIKILILHPEKTVPELKPTGTVAGVEGITLVGLAASEKAPSFWAQVTSGTVFVQLVRAIVYFFGFIFGLLVILLPAAFVGDFLDKRKRKKRVEVVRKSISEYRPEYEWVLTDYVENGGFGLSQINVLLQRPQKIYEYLERKHIGFYVGRTPLHAQLRAAVSQLVDRKLVERKEGKVVVDEQFRKFIAELSKALGYSGKNLPEIDPQQNLETD